MPPISFLIKPASGSCNMRCRYCFYADEQAKRTTYSHGNMSAETMHRIVDRGLAFADRECSMAFQGGEPTLIGLDFFRDLTTYVREHANPKHIKVNYSIQTNGYALNEEWAEFLGNHHFLVGISLDGTKELHDRYRKDAAGRETYGRVMGAIRLLEKYRVEYNILTVITAATARNSQKIYNFFKKNGMTYQQYIECLDPIGEIPGGQEYSLTPEKYANFLKGMFDAWYLDRKAGNYVYNRYFENLLMILDGQMPESCGMRGVCSHQWVFEADGSTYPCDFYAVDEWLLGNINTDSLEMMEAKREELGFVQKSKLLSEECRRCKWLALCRGGCRRHREMGTEKGYGRNYFCKAYQEFFTYAFPRLCEIYQMTILRNAGIANIKDN